MSTPESLHCELRKEGLIIRLGNRDVFDKKLATFQTVSDIIQARKPKATLLDLSAVPGLMSFLDRYELGELAGRYFAGLLIGVLIRPDQLDSKRLGQLVAKNRGVHIEVFTQKTEAEAWLKKVPARRSYPPVATA